MLSALIHGIPLVLVPTEWDKPEVARRAEAAGAAICIDPAECTSQRLRDAVFKVIRDESYRVNARRLAESFQRLGGPLDTIITRTDANRQTPLLFSANLFWPRACN